MIQFQTNLQFQCKRIRYISTQCVINISYSLALTSVDSIVFDSQLLSLGLVFEFELFLWLLANANSFIWRLTAIALYACCKVEWVNMSWNVGENMWYILLLIQVMKCRRHLAKVSIIMNGAIKLFLFWVMLYCFICMKWDVKITRMIVSLVAWAYLKLCNSLWQFLHFAYFDNIYMGNLKSDI